MDRRRGIRTIGSLGVLLVIAVVHYSNVPGSGDVRPILVISLIPVGMILGIMLKTVIDLFRSGERGSQEDTTR